MTINFGKSNYNATAGDNYAKSQGYHFPNNQTQQKGAPSMKTADDRMKDSQLKVKSQYNINFNESPKFRLNQTATPNNQQVVTSGMRTNLTDIKQSDQTDNRLQNYQSTTPKQVTTTRKNNKGDELVKKHILADTIPEKLKHKDFGFRCLHYSVQESAGGFDVMIHNKKNIASKVKVLTYDDTANAGDDYEALNEVVIFDQGEPFKTVSVKILHGNKDSEQNESFFIQLYDQIKGIPLVGKDTKTKITIIEDDTTPEKQSLRKGYTDAGYKNKIEQIVSDQKKAIKYKKCKLFQEKQNINNINEQQQKEVSQKLQQVQGVQNRSKEDDLDSIHSYLSQPDQNQQEMEDSDAQMQFTESDRDYQQYDHRAQVKESVVQENQLKHNTRVPKRDQVGRNNLNINIAPRAQDDESNNLKVMKTTSDESPGKDKRVNAKEIIKNIIASKDEKKKQSLLRQNQFQNELNKFRSIVSINTLSQIDSDSQQSSVKVRSVAQQNNIESYEMEFDQKHVNFDNRSSNLPVQNDMFKRKSMKYLSKATLGCDVSDTDDLQSKVILPNKLENQLQKYASKQIPHATNKIILSEAIEEVQSESSRPDGEQELELENNPVIEDVDNAENITSRPDPADEDLGFTHQERLRKSRDVMMKNIEQGMRKRLNPEDVNSLKPHIEAYECYKQHHNKVDEDEVDEILCLKQYFMSHKIKCIKYNYSLESIAQNFSNFQAYIQLSQDGQKLIITNKKPIEKLQYQNVDEKKILEREANKAEKSHASHSKHSHKQGEEHGGHDHDNHGHGNNNANDNGSGQDNENMHSRGSDDQKNHNIVEDNYHPTEINETIDDLEYNETVSSSSCYLSDIQGIVFGGQTSRFWMLRKHINSIPKDHLDKIPFYSWNCITLILPHRDVDLVIKSETLMRMFIKILVYSIKTLDGLRDSALPLIDTLQKADVKAFQQKTGRQLISESRRHNYLQINEYRVYKKVCMKYLVMKIRMKISYIAFEKGMTIIELLLSSILCSYRMFVNEGLIVEDQESKMRQDSIYNDLITNNGGLLRKLCFWRLTEEKNIIKDVSNDESGSKNIQQVVMDKMNMRDEKAIQNEQVKEQIDDALRDIFSQDKAIDMFRDYNSDKKAQMFELRNYPRYLKFKLRIKTITAIHKKITLFYQLKLLKGSLFVRIALKRIELAKELFVMEIEQGREVLIRRNLSQDDLPYSYRFYDFIFGLIQQRMAFDRREFYGLKKAIAISFYEERERLSLLSKVGIIDTSPQGTGSEKLTFQYTVVNKLEKRNINHHKSQFTMDIQRSKYISIDNDINNVKKFQGEETLSGPNGSLAKSNTKADTQMIVNTLNIQYCLPKTVQENRLQELLFKGCYVQKQAHLKSHGQMQQTMALIKNWIDDEYDSIRPILNDYYLKISLKGTRKPKQRRLFWSMYNNPNKQIDSDQFKRFLFEIAELMIIKRRNRVRVKQYEEIKRIVSAKKDFEVKQDMLDHTLERDVKYFGLSGTKNSSRRELYEIQLQVKKVVAKIQQMDKLNKQLKDKKGSQQASILKQKEALNHSIKTMKTMKMSQQVSKRSLLEEKKVTKEVPPKHLQTVVITDQRPALQSSIADSSPTYLPKRIVNTNLDPNKVGQLIEDSFFSDQQLAEMGVDKRNHSPPQSARVVVDDKTNSPLNVPNKSQPLFKQKYSKTTLNTMSKMTKTTRGTDYVNKQLTQIPENVKGENNLNREQI